METATRKQRKGVLCEHRTAADRQSIGLILQLTRRADGAKERMPAGDGSTGNGHKQHRPQRLPGRTGGRRPGKGLDRFQCKCPNSWFDERSEDGADSAQTNGQQCDPEADIVDWLSEPPDRKGSRKIGKREQEQCPEEIGGQCADLASVRVVDGCTGANTFCIGRRDTWVGIGGIRHGHDRVAARNLVDGAVEGNRCTIHWTLPIDATIWIGSSTDRPQHHSPHGHQDNDRRDHNQIHFPLIEHLTRKEAHHGKHDDPKRHIWAGCHQSSHNSHKGAGNQ
jgi:hypothetical protein